MIAKQLLAFLLIGAGYTSAQSVTNKTVHPGSPDPQLLQQYFEQGQSALVANRYDEARKIYEELLKLAPGMAEVHAWRLAQLAELLGEPPC